MNYNLTVLNEFAICTSPMIHLIIASQNFSKKLSSFPPGTTVLFLKRFIPVISPAGLKASVYKLS